MSVLAVVDLLNAVPPGPPPLEGGVLFAMPAPLVWLLAAGLAVAVLVLSRRMAGRAQAWWRHVRRVRRDGPRVAVESLGVSSL